MNEELDSIKVIKIDPMLPCGATPENPSKICGKPTSLAYAVAMPERSVLYSFPLPGRWLIQPLCKDCARRMMAEFDDDDDEDNDDD